ncbi:Scm-like with four MBT domains protein 2 [Collichthys lucidus]|uniref:Scm-like with four MBT domains protein 2 n=1 Tax=Collichthys lucidus TaxID=240159 RepID=A0A4V6ATX8_COLLU|nr:Scm-like with four MBT domains protein 2 [Collichthys lucidus]
MQSCKQEQPLALAAVKSHYPTNGKEEEVNTDADNMEEEAEFNWEEYMEETGATGAPHTTFRHVTIKEKYSDWTEFLIHDLTGSRTAPANLLEGPLRGKNTVDLIVEGSVLELQDVSDPLLYWPVHVLHNVGGRLRLRYAGLSDDNQADDTWLFYLDVRLRPLGWALENRLTLEPPTALRSLRSASDWQKALEDARLDGQASPLPLEVFKDHVDLPKHSFKTGMKLEMVSPWERLQICPVSVTKVYDEIYFQVMLDDLSVESKPRFVVCHASSPGILPVQWCLKNGVGLERPPGYDGQDFDWADYLKHSGTEAAPDACFPDITQVRGRLLWLRLEGVVKPLSECIVDVESMDIFPVGWLAPSQPVETTPVNHCQPVAVDPGSANGRYCCSKIFVNHRCFSGPYLNKGRIAELPQAVGPGKCTLVLKELLSMLINAAYKPGRVLKELQELEDQSWDCQEETLKAKYKGKTYRSTIRIVRIADQIPDFCRKVCVKLQCCSNLFSPVLVTDKCPENCSVQTKTKYTYYYGKKRKLSKPMGGEEAAEGDLAKPTRRRKKRKAIFVQKKRRSSTVDYTPAGSPQDSDEGEEDEEMALQSGSEGTSSEPREDHTDASSVEVTSSRPRRAVTLRRAFSTGNTASSREVPEGRRRSTRSLSAYNQSNKYQPPKGQDMQVEEEGQLVLDRNPLEWSVDEDIDGQALLLLTLPTVQECMDLKLGPAIKLCHQIERVKVAFYKQYAN